MAVIHFFDSLPSTMDEARSRILQGEEDGSVIVAFHQAGGRGRRGRTWESPFGNLYLTYMTYLNVPLSRAPQLSLVACVAVGEKLRSFLPPTHHLTYKWPNDLLLNEKKVGGLLLEAVPLSEKKEIGYLIGCGLNLKIHPENGRYPATSFQNEGIYLSLEEVLQGIAKSFQRYIFLWQKEGFNLIYTLWMKNAANLDKKVSLDLQGKIQEGLFKGIDIEGAMLLKTPQDLIKVTVGEIL